MQAERAAAMRRAETQRGIETRWAAGRAMQDGSNTVNHASESTQGRACFVLIPGAGGMASYWHRVAPLLEAARHEVIAVDLPGDDPRAGLNEYADIVLRAIGARASVILVAHSLAGFTVPLVLERAAVRSLIFVNAMIRCRARRRGPGGITHRRSRHG
jgi:pimeloyl-ACP methyl ester carboxylesterase